MPVTGIQPCTTYPNPPPLPRSPAVLTTPRRILFATGNASNTSIPVFAAASISTPGATCRRAVLFEGADSLPIYAPNGTLAGWAHASPQAPPYTILDDPSLPGVVAPAYSSQAYDLTSRKQAFGAIAHPTRLRV